MTAKNKRAAKPAGKGPAVQVEPSFYREQLTAALEVSPDMVRALPREARLCTVPGTEEVINQCMTRKV